jgi:hypothetical protein
MCFVNADLEQVSDLETATALRYIAFISSQSGSNGDRCTATRIYRWLYSPVLAGMCLEMILYFQFAS